MHLQAAKKQQKRINGAIINLNSFTVKEDMSNIFTNTKLKELHRKLIDELLFEVHFYFIAWNGCSRMLKLIARQSKSIKIKQIYSRHKNILEHYINGRNSFEHFEERLSTEKNNDKVKKVSAGNGAGDRQIFFGFSFQYQNFKHSDKEWDISEKSFTELQSIVIEIKNELDCIVSKKLR